MVHFVLAQPFYQKQIISQGAPSSKKLRESTPTLDEDAAIARGDLRRWENLDYQIRVEELSKIQDMLNQLILTLKLPALCLTDYNNSAYSLARIVEKYFPIGQWKGLPEKLSVS